MKLTPLQIDRRIFNRWYSQTYACCDGRYAHMPKYLKSDLWEAWQAGRLALKEKT